MTDLQQTLDDAPPGPVLIALPPGRYDLPAPLLVSRDNVSIVAPGRGQATLAGEVSRGGHCVVVAPRPEPPQWGPSPFGGAARSLTLADHRCGVRFWSGGSALGSTAYQKWGLWGDVSGLTIDAAFTLGTGDFDVCPLLGLDAFEGQPSPWLLSVQPRERRYHLALNLTTGPVTVSWPMGPDKLQRVCVQINFLTGMADAWDGTPGATLPVTGGPLRKLTLLTPNGTPTLAAFAVRGVPGGVTWHGASWRPQVTYTYGTPVRRLDGKPVTDATRYQVAQADDQWLLETDVPRPGPWLTAYQPCGGGEWGLVHGPELWDTWRSVSGTTLQGLSLTRQQGLGAGLSLGAAYDTRVQDCRLEGGAHGLAKIPGAPVAYPVEVFGSKLTGAESGLFGAGWRIDGASLKFGNCGRRVVRLEGGCTGGIAPAFADQPGPLCDYYVSIDGSDDESEFVLENFGVDDEGAGHAKAGVLVTARRAGRTSVTVVRSGSNNLRGPLVECRPAPGRRVYVGLRDQVIYAAQPCGVQYPAGDTTAAADALDLGGVRRETKADGTGAVPLAGTATEEVR